MSWNNLNPYEDHDKRNHCSFCGKAKSEVAVIIEGPHVEICSECVAVSFEIVSCDSGLCCENLKTKEHPCPLKDGTCQCCSYCAGYCQSRLDEDF